MLVTADVKVNQVFFSVSASILNWHNMVGMQLFSIKQVFTTYWARPVLVVGYVV
jgi:hypothetical protein